MASWESVVRIDRDPSSMVVNVEIVIVSVVNVCCKCRDVTSVHRNAKLAFLFFRVPFCSAKICVPAFLKFSKRVIITISI